MPPRERHPANGGATGEGREIQALQRQAKALFDAGRLRPALKSCLDLLELQPERPDVLSFAGMIAGQLGQPAEAAALFEAALQLMPDFAEAHYNLANMLDRLGKLEAAAESHGRALRLRPGLAPAWHNLGGILRRLGRTEEAEQAYRRALELKPASAETARDLGLLLQSNGRGLEALEIFRRGLVASPRAGDLHSHLVHALMEQGEAASAVAACERWLRAVPGDLQATALKAIALNEAGDRAAAAFLLDFDRFVQVVDLAPPPAFASLAAFNAALVEHVLHHPTLKVPPKYHPTYHNDFLQITDELLAEPKGPMAELERLTRLAIERYVAGLPASPPHPYLAHWPAKWRLTAWATVLEGQGNLVPHMHLEGYLGAVYYPALPAAVSEAAAGEAGWIELGRPPEALAAKATPLLRRIQPKEGRLLLFPGYFFHCTLPFQASTRRVSIAFDLMRAG